MQIQISWLLQKPTDLDLHCLQNRVYPGSAGQELKGAHCKERSAKDFIRDLFNYAYAIFSDFPL